MKRYTNDMKIY